MLLVVADHATAWNHRYAPDCSCMLPNAPVFFLIARMLLLTRAQLRWRTRLEDRACRLSHSIGKLTCVFAVGPEGWQKAVDTVCWT